MLPTFVAAAGEPDIDEKIKKGYKAGNKTFKVHLDGFNLMPHLKGEVEKNPRPGFLYWSDEGDLMALRYGNWKIHFAEQRAVGADAWQEPFAKLKAPKLMNLRSDPFEEADISSFYYWDWRGERLFALVPAAPWWPNTSRPWWSSRRGNRPRAGVLKACWRSSGRMRRH